MRKNPPDLARYSLTCFSFSLRINRLNFISEKTKYAKKPLKETTKCCRKTQNVQRASFARYYCWPLLLDSGFSFIGIEVLNTPTKNLPLTEPLRKSQNPAPQKSNLRTVAFTPPFSKIYFRNLLFKDR